ncbi:MAG: amidohydrolase [Clostridiales Family XIII bacterium]|jgi:predicted amidohydrolase YtcJ|nr:amidohydrolase [Clostridiales Family XIII bacterium]
MGLHADLVLKGAHIVTMDDRLPTAEALAVQGEQIIGVGAAHDFETVTDADTVVLDLGGSTVVPGLNDNHCHPLTGAQNLAAVDISGTKNHAELFAMLRDRAARTPEGEFIVAYGFQEHLWEEGRVPTLAEMDAALPHHPLHITRACQHTGLTNSPGLAFMHWDDATPDPSGGTLIREGGKLTGELHEAANFALRNSIPQMTTDQLAESMKEMSRQYNSYGITSTTDMGLLNGRDDEYVIWGKVLANDYLTVRTAAYLFTENYERMLAAQIPLPLGDSLYRLHGRKIIIDGSGGPATARMTSPSYTRKDRGILYYNQEQLDAAILQAHLNGHQIAAHAIGDEAIGMLLDSYEKAQARLPRPDIRHRIEHCSFALPPLPDRIARAKVYPCFSTGYFYFFGEAHLANYGLERVQWELPYRAIFDRGIECANATDAPVLTLDPAPSLYGAIARRTAKGDDCGQAQRCTPYEALRSYTYAGAFLTHEEKIKGTLTAGKLADITVLNMDPTDPTLTEEPERILDLKIQRTILGGKTVYEG